MTRRKAHATWIRDDCLHIETELGIVNIYVGLNDFEGRTVESVEIQGDDHAGEQKVIVDDGTMNPTSYLRVRMVREAT